MPNRWLLITFCEVRAFVHEALLSVEAETGEEDIREDVEEKEKEKERRRRREEEEEEVYTGTGTEARKNGGGAMEEKEAAHDSLHTQQLLGKEISQPRWVPRYVGTIDEPARVPSAAAATTTAANAVPATSQAVGHKTDQRRLRQAHSGSFTGSFASSPTNAAPTYALSPAPVSAPVLDPLPAPDPAAELPSYSSLDLGRSNFDLNICSAATASAIEKSTAAAGPVLAAPGSAVTAAAAATADSESWGDSPSSGSERDNEFSESTGYFASTDSATATAVEKGVIGAGKTVSAFESASALQGPAEAFAPELTCRGNYCSAARTPQEEIPCRYSIRIGFGQDRVCAFTRQRDREGLRHDLEAGLPPLLLDTTTTAVMS